MKYLSVKEQLRAERRKNEAREAENAQTKADIEYVAMMSGVELEIETEVQSNDKV